LSDVQARLAGDSGPQPVETRALDLDGDRTDEVLAWTSGGDLVVMGADGREWWRRREPARIIAVDAWDLGGDTKREVFISRGDRRVVVLGADGSPRWEADFSDIYRRTDEQYFGDGSVIFGMAAWRPGERTEPEVLFTGYFHAAALDAAGAVERCFRRAGHFTQIRAVPPGFPGSGGLVMRSDIPWVGPVPLEWWSASDGSVSSECSVPNGESVFFELDDLDGDGHVEALVATEQGIGAYAPTEPKTRWEHMTDAPPAGAGIIRGTSGVPATIVYAREDGYVFVLNADGTVLRSTVLDEPIRCATALRTGEGVPVLVVGTRRGLRCLRLDDLVELWRKPGAYQHLERMTVGGRPRLLTVAANGQLALLEL
jgi:hypothetical protein